MESSAEGCGLTLMKLSYDDLAAGFEEDIFEFENVDRDSYCVPIGALYYISGSWYILGRTNMGFTLIDLYTGNRWTDPIRQFTERNNKIKLSDFQILIGRGEGKAKDVLKTRKFWNGISK